MEAITQQPEIYAHDLARDVQSSSCNGSDEHDQTAVLPGFRFHPTEEELVGHYLRRMLQGHKLPIHLIPTVDLCSFDPWELPAMAGLARYEPTDYWYFFVPRSSKFRHGERPNRLTKSGYWKATGTDTRIRAAISEAQKHEHHIQGHHDHQRHHHQYFSALRKTMVFYEGRAPRGIKTCWIMDEYRMDHSSSDPHLQQNTIHPHDQNVDSTICRLRLKRLMRWPASSTSGASNFGGAGSVTPNRQDILSMEGEERHHEVVSLHFASTSDNSTPPADSNYSTQGPHVQTLSLHDMDMMDGAPASHPKNKMRRSCHRPVRQLSKLACRDMVLPEACTSALWTPSPGLARPKGNNYLFSPLSLDELLLNLQSSHTHTHNGF